MLRGLVQCMRLGLDQLTVGTVQHRLQIGQRGLDPIALAGLKHVLTSSDRDAILQWTQVLNDVTRHLAEVMMNRSVQGALSGKNINRL